jgi:hypothetical protein
MSSHLEWQTVYDFWFPRDLPTADASRQWQMLEWWMRGGANAELPQFAPSSKPPDQVTWSTGSTRHAGACPS